MSSPLFAKTGGVLTWRFTARTEILAYLLLRDKSEEEAAV